MADLKLQDMLSLLNNVRRSGNGYSSRCPAHDDRKNSLAVSEGESGKLLLKCFGGCSFQTIIAALGISTNGNSTGNGRTPQIEAIYDYTDEAGNMLYQCVRFEGKDFRWRQFDAGGKEVWNLKGVRRVPYQLPKLVNLPADADFVMTEGEKDTDTLTAHKLISTNHKNWQSEFNYLLKGKRVVIFQDHDKAGVELAEKTARVILRDAQAVKIIDCFADEPLPDKHGKDVSDHLQTHSFDALLELVRNTPNREPHSNGVTSWQCDEAGLKVVCLSDVVAEEIVWLWKPYIPVGAFTIVEGIEGLGKSWIGCCLACAVADGKSLPFDDSEPMEPGNVLMLSAEDSLSHTVKPRLVSMNANLKRIFALDDLFSFSDLKDLIKFEAVVAEYQPKLVIIDPIFSYTGGKNLNQESDSRPIAAKIIEIAKKFDCAIIGVRHIGKAKGNGDARAAGLGSIAWRASARSVLLVGKDEETGEKAICQTKNNLAEESKIAVGFRISNDGFSWNAEPSRLTKERMLAQPKDDETKADQDEAVEFLREALRDGERQSKDVDANARKLGISTYALKKARSTLGVKPLKKGGTYGGEKGWFICLPGDENKTNNSEEADLTETRLLQSKGGNKTSYGNSLTEEVESKNNQPLQPTEPTSSAGSVPSVQMPEVCKCGADAFVGEVCQSCGEVVIPF
ncbi:MAG: AAA family ATPase [Pyrinomonadaceae bacterium]